MNAITLSVTTHSTGLLASTETFQLGNGTACKYAVMFLLQLQSCCGLAVDNESLMWQPASAPQRACVFAVVLLLLSSLHCFVNVWY